MAAKKSNPAMEFLLAHLKKNKKATYAECKEAAGKKKLEIWPIMFGRAQAMLGIVKQAQQNFWTHLVAASNRYGGTICNRDYEISREGTGFDTKYHIIPIDPDPDLKDLDVVKKFYGYGKEFDQSDPDRFLFCPQTLHDWAKNYASEERVKYWLAPKEGSAEPSGMDEFASATTSNSGDEAQVVTPQSTDFGSLKERLLKNK